MKFSELLGLPDLSGFRIAKGYWIELRHGLMGTFPALVSKTKEPFFCLSEAAIKRALSLLSPRHFKIDTTFLLVDDEKKIAFDLLVISGVLEFGTEAESYPVLLEEDIEKMRAGDLRWAPGLVGNDMTLEEFREALSVAVPKTGC